jgi:hypothetical protein
MFISTSLGVIFGSLITFFVSKHYYSKSTSQLMNASEESKKMSEFIVHILEQNGNKNWEVIKDNQGRITKKLNITLSVSDVISLTDLSDAIIKEEP